MRQISIDKELEMAKSYEFNEKDLIDLLMNHLRFMAFIGRKLSDEGEDIRSMANDELRMWTRQYIEAEVWLRDKMNSEEVLNHIKASADEIIKGGNNVH